MTHHRIRSFATVVAVGLTAALVLNSAQPASAQPSASARAAGVRYVDLVFTNTTLQSNVSYATAPDLVSGTATNLLLDVYQPRPGTGSLPVR